MELDRLLTLLATSQYRLCRSLTSETYWLHDMETSLVGTVQVPTAMVHEGLRTGSLVATTDNPGTEITLT